MTVNISIGERYIGDELIKTCDGRELHAELGVAKDYTSWAKAQIKRGRLVENRDYVKLTQKGELSATGQTRSEYHFTVEAGKHIGMMSGTERGHEVREYFIACERIAKGLPAQPRVGYAVGPHDTLTPTEQDELRAVLTDAAQQLPLKQRGAFLQRGWSKLKAHFKVSYREIPRREFTEALSIAARHAGEVVAAPPLLPAPSDQALKQALDSMHLMAGSLADLTAVVVALAGNARDSPHQAEKGEGLTAPTVSPSIEKRAAPTAHNS